MTATSGTFARAAETGLAKLAALAIANRGCCFTFHRAAAEADWSGLPNRGFHLDLAYLGRLIKHLQRTGWECVTMSEALRRLDQPGAGRFVNFSVDDCYRDTAELVIPLFRRLGAPVTLYLTTGIPDRLFRLRNAGLETIIATEPQVSDAGDTFPVRNDEEKRAVYRTLSARWELLSDPDEHYEQFCRRHGHDADALDERHRMTWSMLEELIDDPLVEIGGHTVSHRRISTLDVDTATAEIAGCRTRVESMLGRPVRHFAFPYGRAGDCSERDFALAKRAGFESASTTRKGLVEPNGNRFCLPRNTLNGLHRQLPFAYAHLSGLSGLAARVMHRD